jgi:PleD family two-component response regulator
MIFTDSAVPHCRKILETVLAELEAADIAHPTAESGVVTLSAGFADCESVSHIKDCLDAADRALFRAKRAGRRQVIGYRD